MASVVINQPYYYPQLHWWNRALSADVVVLLDDVDHNTSFPVNRTIVYDGVKERYLTIPIKKEQKHKPIIDIEIVDKTWPIKHRDMFINYYKNSKSNEQLKFFFDVIVSLERVNYLHTVIHNSIISFINELRWPFDPIYSSNLKLNGDVKKNDRLIEICKKVNADKLILGMGSKNYIDLEINKYNDNGIQIEYQNWSCPVENYSVLDTVARYGLDRTKEILYAK
jgi:hypothetical protein